MNLKVTSVASGDVGLANRGYWGIGLRDNNTYKVSFWAKRGSNFSGTLIAKLESNEGKVYAQSADFKPTGRILLVLLKKDLVLLEIFGLIRMTSIFVEMSFFSWLKIWVLSRCMCSIILNMFR